MYMSYAWVFLYLSNQLHANNGKCADLIILYVTPILCTTFEQINKFEFEFE